MPKTIRSGKMLGLYNQCPLVWQLEYNPDCKLGDDISHVMEMPEPDRQETLYRLGCEADCLIHMEQTPWWPHLEIHFAWSRFRQMNRRQREAILANLWETIRKFRSFPVDRLTVTHLAAEFAQRYGSLIALESAPGDFQCGC